MKLPGKIAVLGSSGHALSVLEAALSAGFEPVAVVDPLIDDLEIFGLPRLVDVSSLDLGTVALCLGVGPNFLRESVFDSLRKEFPESRFPPIIHKTASVSPSATISEGAVVLSQANVGARAEAGVGALLNTGASLDHDSNLGDFSSLGPGAKTGGDVTIGARTMVGLNAGIIHGISIGADSVIGAMSLVLQDISSLTIALGVPSTPKGSRTREEPYY
jgi:sugar O-acyltransferase (sialic acid O-acetyltransferase NeuD family)